MSKVADNLLPAKLREVAFMRLNWMQELKKRNACIVAKIIEIIVNGGKRMRGDQDIDSS